MTKWKQCNNCHGHGEIQKEVKPGKWERQVCRACGGTGLVNAGLV